MRRLLALLLAGCSPAPEAQDDQTEQARLGRYVDPFIGTANEGNTFPGAVAPWGMVSASPHTTLSTPLSYLTGDPIAPSGYLHGEPTIRGFGLTHLSGVGCPELGAPVLAPFTGAVPDEPNDYASAYAKEFAAPGTYAVDLTTHGVHVEVTVRERAGIMRLTFEDGAGSLLIDAEHDLAWTGADFFTSHLSDGPANGGVRGFAQTGGFCAQGNKQRVFFGIRFRTLPDALEVWHPTDLGARGTADGGRVARWSGLDGPVEIAFAVSYVSDEAALANLDAELENWSFDDVSGLTAQAWEQVLGAVEVEGGTEDDRTRLYTALYHSAIHPSLAEDVDGGFPPFGGRILDAPSERHHVYSLWDTYRTVHPLFALLWPDKQRLFAQNLLEMTREARRPPQWELAAAEVQMMVGDPAGIVLADTQARLGDLPGLEEAWDDLVGAVFSHNDTLPNGRLQRPGHDDYTSKGFIPMDQASEVWGPVSTQLEYALGDAALADLADHLGRDSEATQLRASAASWTALYDPDTTLLRPKERNGDWYTPFDPDALQGSNPVYDPSGGPGYVEGTAWHYAWFVPHDIAGLTEKRGGVDASVKHLDALFDEGRFAMWNEPDIGFPWIYTHWTGHEAKAGPRVHALIDEHFGLGPDGIPGNDDAGALSAWLAFALIGLYPDVPGQAVWAAHAPRFDRIHLHPSEGPDITIDASGCTTETFRGFTNDSGPSFRLTHDEVVNAGTLKAVCD